MQQHKPWQWLPAASVLALALLLVMLSALAVNINLARMRAGFRWVQHTDDVLLRVAAIDGDLVEAESTERGYLLTGDDDFHANFTRLHDTLPHQLDSLRETVADNPRQQQRLDQLSPLLGARLEELNQVVTLGPANVTAALAIVQAAKARRLTALIREQLELFRQAELDLLRERQARAARDMTWSIAFAAATTIMALASASYGLFLFRRARALQRERELRAELIHVSRLNMMGQKASMLAHELNQPLTATGNYLRTMLRMANVAQPPLPGMMVEALTRSAAQIDRARDIVQRLRDFIAKGEPAKSVEQIGPIFDEAIALLGMRHDALTVSQAVDPGLPAVLVDKIQVEQVLINLMRNAVEAMENSDRRELALTAHSAGAMVRIAVTDTGPGIPKEVADRLFQPFVTTKSAGMGVGLSICHTIVLANGGRIWSGPNPEGGTVFSFTLPVAPVADTVPPRAAAGSGAPPGGIGTLVEPGF
jgi:C4-dicarboxylate-specific signal transduction histidine kinase